MLLVGTVLSILTVIPLSLQGYTSTDNRIERNPTVLSILSDPENGNRSAFLDPGTESVSDNAYRDQIQRGPEAMWTNGSQDKQKCRRSASDEDYESRLRQTGV